MLLAFSIASADERPNSRELLKTFAKTVERLDGLHIEAVAKEWVKKEAVPDEGRNEKEMLSVTRPYSILRRDFRWRIGIVDQRTGGSGLTSGVEYVFDEFLGKRQALHVQWARLGDDGAQLAHLAVLLPGEPERFQPSRYLGNAAALFGCFEGDEGVPIWKLMEDSASLELLEEPEMIGGHLTWVVKNRGPMGVHTLWLDPEFGCLPRQVTVNRRAGDRFDEIQLGVENAPSTRIPAGARIPARKSPNFTLQEVRQQIELKLQDDNKRYCISAFDQLVEKNVKYADHVEKVSYRTEFRTSLAKLHVEKWPDGAFLPGVSIPDGTPVRTVRQGEQHVWKNGTVE
jgi:hypothetical protein